MKVILLLATLLLVLVSYQNCGPAMESIQESTNGSFNVSGFSGIHQNVIVPRCLSCHSGSNPNGGIDLSTYASIINSGAVTPGDAESSPLYIEVFDGTMPPSAPLSSSLISSIKDWIDAGAAND